MYDLFDFLGQPAHRRLAGDSGDSEHILQIAVLPQKLQRLLHRPHLVREFEQHDAEDAQQGVAVSSPAVMSAEHSPLILRQQRLNGREPLQELQFPCRRLSEQTGRESVGREQQGLKNKACWCTMSHGKGLRLFCFVS